ncbi:phage portal protein [bacterium]|nr:MAG: phage portal protein [bacterium]
MNFLARIGRALTRPIFSGYGGSSGNGQWNANTVAGLLGLPVVDAEGDVGELWKSSIPLSCLKWEQRASIELNIVVQTNDENGDWVNAPKHKALNLLRNPNRFHSAAQLFDCIRWDYHLDGNAYLYKVRSASGRVIELWWIPSWMIDPRWEEGGSEFISCYEYRVNGQVFAIPVDDIIHFRNGLDPRWQGRKGLSEFAGVLREVMSDDEAAVMVASLMKNMGMPGVIISPESSGPSQPSFSKKERADFREHYEESFTGEGRGRAFIHNIPVKIQFPGYNPQQLVLDKVRAIPEQRIGGAFGLPLSVLQLGSGLTNSNSRANKSDDRKQAYESCIIPTSMSLAQELTRGILLEFGCDITQCRVWFDTSEVGCLQNDKVELWKALVAASGGCFLTPNEARKEVGKKPIAGGDDLRASSKVEPTGQIGDANGGEKDSETQTKNPGVVSGSLED